VSHTFSVIPLEIGYQETKRATVQYKESARGKENYGFSTDLGAIFVSRYSEFDKKSAPHLVLSFEMFMLLTVAVTERMVCLWTVEFSSDCSFLLLLVQTRTRKQ
jgi:hypothetical protein